MTLNKEDLMIGDWVMIKDYPMISEPLRMTENHFVRSLCEFEGIPITNEFLMKNGFEFFPMEYQIYGLYTLKTEHCLLKYSNKHGDITIFKARTGSIDGNGNCVGGFYEINHGRFNIEYVHELQHIFKLCKIKIDLEL
jgi:hypothetical protein